MSTFRLPTRQDRANYQLEVALDNLTFRLAFKFNSRDEAWYMTVLDANGVRLRAGIKLVSEWSHLRLWQDFAVRPAGAIVTLNLNILSKLSKAALDQLGTDVLFLYDGEG